MVKVSAVSRGIVNFIDEEILPKMQGWQKWAFGTVAGVMAKKSDSLLNDLAKNPLVKSLGIIDKDGNVDIETIYAELQKQASKTPATIPIPMIGEIRLTSEDVDSLYRYIKNAE